LGWRNTTLPARVAALVHGFAEKMAPLDAELTAAMLRILDRLVDMGDRRSAALQTRAVSDQVDALRKGFSGPCRGWREWDETMH
jgi:hypothetical protein